MKIIDFRMADLRPGIIKLWQEGMKQCVIARAMKISKQTVSYAIRRFKETGANVDRPRSGRPRTAITTDNIEKVNSKICHCKDDDEGHIHSKQHSTRIIGIELGICNKSAHNILKKALQMKSRKMREGQMLNDEVKKLRKSRAQKLLRRFSRGRHRNILFSDEKWFNVETSYNKQNDRIWRKNLLPPDLKIIGRTQKPKQVMVWAGVHWSGKTPLFFVPDGVKVNTSQYLKMLCENVLPWSRQHFGNQHWTYQQDGAPSHKAMQTQNWIRENFPDMITVDNHWKRRNGEWASCSPDWSVLDYFVWPYLQSKACSKPHKSINELKDSLLREWNQIPQDMIQKAIDDFPRRLRKCIDACGSYFE